MRKKICDSYLENVKKFRFKNVDQLTLTLLDFILSLSLIDFFEFAYNVKNKKNMNKFKNIKIFVNLFNSQLHYVGLFDSNHLLKQRHPNFLMNLRN